MLAGQAALQRNKPAGSTTRRLAEIEAAEKDPAVSGERKPKPARAPVSVPQITKALGKWSATLDLLAPVLVQHCGRSLNRELVGQVMELNTDLEEDEQS
ncbi:MAG: hypothetical protein JWN03_7016 [Nocardia sp.]|uniref:hypothetical protein n=1 Tax=Nocardia sp. TaxID=1821 RepID=UPI0026237E12|nr:hypothetical protein [Nocardia sp.]MCU1646741.1 hypothetical protein [Nocardia sp.]